tara:strand:- start:271 stop:576 length:306 start_codon:yes stop_codon:yes gene_type:complete
MSEKEVEIAQRNTVRIDGADYEVETLPNVAKIAIEHLVAIDKEVQRLEMARAGFAQAIKSVMDGEDAPKPVSGTPNSQKPKESANSKGKPNLNVVSDGAPE